MLKVSDMKVFKKYERFSPDVEMSDRAVYRHKRITGSRIGIIMGINRWGGSKFRLAVEMCGDKISTIPRDNLVVRVGSFMEDCIKSFCAEKRTDFESLPDLGTVEHPTCELLAASPDWIVNDRHGPAVVEIKNVGRYTAKEWKDGAHPKYYESQLQWYMGILNDIWSFETGEVDSFFSHGYLVALLENKELAVRFVLFDKDWYETAKAAALEFLMAVEKNEPEAFMFDESDFSDATKALGEASKVEASEMPKEAEKHIYKMSRLKEEAVELQKQIDEERFMLANLIDGAEKSENEKFFVSWPWVRGRRRFDLKAFEKSNPDIDLSSYYTDGKPYRGGMKITTKGD